MEPRILQIRPKQVSIVLMTIAFVFSILSLVVWYVPRRFQIDIGVLYDWFFVDKEQNFPTFYAVLLFLICSLLLFYIAWMLRWRKERFSIHWLLLGIGFFFLACDDFILIHEKLTKPTNMFFRSLRISGIMPFSWVIPAVFLILIAAIFYIPFFMKLPLRQRIIFFLAAFVFVGGALGLETIGGMLKTELGAYSREYMIETSLEEFLEMAGPVIFIYGLLQYVEMKFDTLQIIFTSNEMHSSQIKQP